MQTIPLTPTPYGPSCSEGTVRVGAKAGATLIFPKEKCRRFPSPRRRRTILFRWSDARRREGRRNLNFSEGKMQTIPLTPTPYAPSCSEGTVRVGAKAGAALIFPKEK
ncbi:MAG: hypothetical protein E7424_04835 [Ruminococcaceae bacterium]|nr:hypothetical protein [Oscillospiraceae bacterium]